MFVVLRSIFVTIFHTSGKLYFLARFFVMRSSPSTLSTCVCYFVVLNTYRDWGIITIPGFLHERAKGHARTI